MRLHWRPGRVRPGDTWAVAGGTFVSPVDQVAIEVMNFVTFISITLPVPRSLLFPPAQAYHSPWHILY